MKLKMIAALLLGVALTQPAQAVTYQTPIEVTASATSTKVMDASAFRSYLIILNLGSVAVKVKFGSVQVGYDGVLIPAGGNYEPVQAPTNAMWVRTSSSTSDLYILQGLTPGTGPTQ